MIFHMYINIKDFLNFYKFGIKIDRIEKTLILNTYLLRENNICIIFIFLTIFLNLPSSKSILIKILQLFLHLTLFF